MKKATKTTKATAPSKSKTAAKAPASKPAPAAKQAAPKVKRSPAAKLQTRIDAQIDVGFGNTLYIRGEGPGLSWDRGIAMACISDDCWSVSLPEAGRPVVCKFLLNDLVWSTGEDFVVMPGKSITLTPMF